jgi:hypothetical protein
VLFLSLGLVHVQHIMFFIFLPVAITAGLVKEISVNLSDTPRHRAVLVKINVAVECGLVRDITIVVGLHSSDHLSNPAPVILPSC